MRHLFIILLIFGLTIDLCAQEIDFGSYGSYTEADIIIGAGGVNGDLDFGYIMTDSGVHSIELAGALEIEIVGIEYLDVFVDIQTSYNNQLILDGDEGNIDDPQKSISFNLEAAFSNVGEATNSPGNATIIPISNGVGSARFPVRKERFTPPGPPPPPPTSAFSLAEVEDTAILYLYGSIDVGDVDAGLYTGLVEVTVSYEFPP